MYRYIYNEPQKIQNLEKKFIDIFYHIFSGESCMITLKHDTILSFGGVNMNILDSNKNTKNLEISMNLYLLIKDGLLL